MANAPGVGGAALEDDDRMAGLEQGFEQVTAKETCGAGEENGLVPAADEG